MDPLYRRLRCCPPKQGDKRPKCGVRVPAPPTHRWVLPGQDSNLERQDQNLVCYHYTTGQEIPDASRAGHKRTSVPNATHAAVRRKDRGGGPTAEA